MRVDWDEPSLLCCFEECPTGSRGRLGAGCRRAVTEILSCVSYMLGTGHGLGSCTTAKDPRDIANKYRSGIFMFIFLLKLPI